MTEIDAKTIVTRTKSTGWFGASYNMNIYRGCCHGCIYCDSRSTCYRNDRFDEVCIKKNALQIIRDDLRRKVQRGVIGTGAMSDPYNPFERELQLTRHALELISAYGFGVSVATKSDLVARDIDVLREIGESAPALVQLTITTADDALAKVIEPHAPPPSARFGALRDLIGAGIFAGILMMPILPFINDTEENLLGVVEGASRCGARFIYPSMGMTLRDGNRQYYYAALDRVFPGLSARYQSVFGERYVCNSPRARELWRAFAAACDRAGIAYKMDDIIKLSKLGYDSPQLRFEV